MQRCVNGHWLNDNCRCNDFWTGDACNERHCEPNGYLNRSDPQHACECLPGYIGEFCQIEICIHRRQWYCNETQSTTTTTTPNSNLNVGTASLCPPDVLEQWFRQNHHRHQPQEFLTFLSTSDLGNSSKVKEEWFCDCGSGVHSSDPMNSTCLCDQGYYGEFCQLAQCPPHKRLNVINGTCDTIYDDGKNSTLTLKDGLGFFGYDINLEFGVTCGIVLFLILAFFVIGRIILKRLESRPVDITSPTALSFANRRKSSVSLYFDKYHKTWATDQKSNEQRKNTKIKNQQPKTEKRRSSSVPTPLPPAEFFRYYNQQQQQQNDNIFTTKSSLSSPLARTKIFPASLDLESLTKPTTTTANRNRHFVNNLETVSEGIVLPNRNSHVRFNLDNDKLEEEDDEIDDNIADERFRERMMSFSMQCDGESIASEDI